MENKELIIAYIPALISIIGALIAIWKAKPEKKKLEADTSSSIADAAESIANGANVTIEQLLGRMREMEKREHDREEAYKTIKADFENIKTSLAEWQDWARRLVHQLRSHGLEPVPFKPVPPVPSSASAPPKQ